MKTKFILLTLFIFCVFTCLPSFIWAQYDHGSSSWQNGSGQNNQDDNDGNKDGNHDGNHDRDHDGNHDGNHEKDCYDKKEPASTAAPFDGGQTLLMAAGIGIGAKKANDKMKRLKQQLPYKKVINIWFYLFKSIQIRKQLLRWS